MRRDDILSFTRAQPFRPFRVTLVNGEVYNIQHPDMVIATNGMAVFARPDASNREDESGSVVHVSLPLILKVEFLTSDANPPAAARATA